MSLNFSQMKVSFIIPNNHLKPYPKMANNTILTSINKKNATPFLQIKKITYLCSRIIPNYFFTGRYLLPINQ